MLQNVQCLFKDYSAAQQNHQLVQYYLFHLYFSWMAWKTKQYIQEHINAEILKLHKEKEVY